MIEERLHPGNVRDAKCHCAVAVVLGGGIGKATDWKSGASPSERIDGCRCLEAILAEPGWTVRILTKNAAVANDFDLIGKHKDRALRGLSLTAPQGKSAVIKAVARNASTIHERMAAMKEARRLGLRPYAMFCPLLPGIAATVEPAFDPPPRL